VPAAALFGARAGCVHQGAKQSPEWRAIDQQFGVELHPKPELLRPIFDCLDDAIRLTRAHGHAGAQPVDRLQMNGVDLHLHRTLSQFG